MNGVTVHEHASQSGVARAKPEATQELLRSDSHAACERAKHLQSVGWQALGGKLC